MYKSITVLNAAEHSDFRFTPAGDLKFAKDMNVIPITFSEVQKLCCDFPIVYLGGETPSIVVVVGFDEEGKNLAIDEEGRWRGEYVPAFLRRYPFVMVKTGEDEMSLGVDLQSGCFSNPEGEALFGEDGTPTEKLSGIGEFLQNLEGEFATTRALVAELEKAEVLKERVLSIGEGEDARKIGGFKSVEHSALTALGDEKLAGWARSGLLELIALQQFSIKNFRKLIEIENAGRS